MLVWFQLGFLASAVCVPVVLTVAFVRGTVVVSNLCTEYESVIDDAALADLLDALNL